MTVPCLRSLNAIGSPPPSCWSTNCAGWKARSAAPAGAAQQPSAAINGRLRRRRPMLRTTEHRGGTCAQQYRVFFLTYVLPWNVFTVTLTWLAPFLASRSKRKYLPDLSPVCALWPLLENSTLTALSSATSAIRTKNEVGPNFRTHLPRWMFLT